MTEEDVKTTSLYDDKPVLSFDYNIDVSRVDISLLSNAPYPCTDLEFIKLHALRSRCAAEEFCDINTIQIAAYNLQECGAGYAMLGFPYIASKLYEQARVWVDRSSNLIDRLEKIEAEKETSEVFDEQNPD